LIRKVKSKMKKRYEARYPVPPEEFYSEFTCKEEKPPEIIGTH
jgi:hypothetical protein